MAEGRIDKSDFDAVSGRITQRECQPCLRKDQQTAADVFCSTCDEFQCTKCSDIHNIYAYMKTHKLVNASEVKSKPVTLDLNGLDLCKKHKRKYEFFCEDDMELCCSKCAIVSHRKCHSVQEIESIVEKSRLATPNFNTTLQDMKGKAEIVGKQMQICKEQLRQNIKDLPKKISHMQDEMNKMFDDLKCHVSRETEKFQIQTEEKLMKKQAISETLVTEINNSLELINKVYQNGTPSQAFILDHRIEGQIKELQMELEKACQDLETVTVSFDFDGTLQLPPRPISDYIPGQLTFNYNIPESVKCIADKQPTVKLERITSIDLNQATDDVEEPLYSGLDFLPDGRLVAVDNHNEKCLVFNEKLEKVGSYQLTYIPGSVVVVSEEEMAITSNAWCKIDFLRVRKSNEITVIKTCKVKTQYGSICMKDDENFIVGTVDSTPPVRIVSLTGEEKDFSINFPPKKCPLGSSCCTYIKNSDKLVLTDRYEHTVYIYDIGTNTSVVVKDDRIKRPYGVAVGPSDVLMVCSKNTDSLVQITVTGQVLASYQLDMKCPYRVCVSRDMSILAVTNNCKGKRKLQLFNIKHS